MVTDDTRTQWCIVILLGLLIPFAAYSKINSKVEQTPPPYFQQPYWPESQPEPPRKPQTPTIGVKMPPHLSYDQMVSQIKTWEQEAPDLVETGTYGKSTRGTDLYFIKLTNELLDDPNKKVVMITASLHGNEPWSTGCTMAYIGDLLSSYGQDSDKTELLDTRIICFVPIVSPDSYPHSRHVDGVDPNRNFPTEREPNRRSVAPVRAIQDLFNQIKPNAVISGHTYGRVYLYPYGDKTQLCPHDTEFKRIVGEMGRLSQYRLQRACQMYNRPIYGTEVDWYYKNGAFAIVMEFGSHQRKPSTDQIKSEFERTYKAVLHFIEEAPEVQIRGGFSDYFPTYPTFRSLW